MKFRPKPAQSLTHLPPLNYQKTSSPIHHISVLPPLQYPDGRHYIKLALTSRADKSLPDFDAISAWFRHPSPFPYLADIKTILASLLPQVDVLSWHEKPCVAAYTPTLKPMIDCLVNERIYVALGGNAGAAHTSDAIGKLAADFVLNNRWSSLHSHTQFQLQWADDWRDWLDNPSSVWHTAEANL